MLLLRNLKTFWTVFIFLNCVYSYVICFFMAVWRVCVPSILKVHRSLFIPVPGTYWIYSVGKSFFSSGNFSWITLISSLFHSELCLDIEPPGLVIRASFLSYDFSFSSTSWVISSTLFRVLFLNILFLLSKFYSHAIFFVLAMSPFY